MKISGTLPAVARRQESWMSNLEVIGIAQNYLHGETSGLNHASKMTTLLLSGNYLSCNGAGLEQSLDLGEGRFQAPQIQAKLQILNLVGSPLPPRNLLLLMAYSVRTLLQVIIQILNVKKRSNLVHCEILLMPRIY